ncbi:hypothetical protein [Salinigranum sp. GCM10025319]|uniref:hypothetical protein n=1 Tax=Salinigranum sp. GCM10025319 TaxID=3252687 RepID=UPI00361C4C08
MVEIITDEKDWGAIVRVDIPGKEAIYFAGFDKKEEQRRADIYRKLYDKCGSFDTLEVGNVPLKIACSGNPALAAYMYAVQRQPVQSIALHLKVSPSTVEQYLSDIRRGRR